MGGPVPRDPCLPLGTVSVITAPDGLLDRTRSTKNEDFAGSELGIIQTPSYAK